MLVTLLPGVSRENALGAMREIHNQAFNLRGGGSFGGAHGRLTAYVDWANEAARRLHYPCACR